MEVKAMKTGYVRVSTLEQNEARQVKALLEAGVAEDAIYIDKKSGKNTDREQLQALLRFVRKGDVVVTESISRVARNTKDLLSIIEELTNRGVDFVSLKENIDTTTPQGRFMLTVFAAIATLDRESILERQREGIEIAKSRNVYKGGKKKDIDRKKFTAIVQRWRSGEMTATEAMKLLELKPNTFYRRVNEWGL